MGKKLAIKTIVAIGIGAAVFMILGRFGSIPTGIPNTNLETSYAFLALMSVIFGPVAGAANTITDCDYLVYRNEMLRKVENLTIVGAKGATVEAFKVVAGYIEGSTGYVVDIKNLVIFALADYISKLRSFKIIPLFYISFYSFRIHGREAENCI